MRSALYGRLLGTALFAAGLLIVMGLMKACAGMWEAVVR